MAEQPDDAKRAMVVRYLQTLTRGELVSYCTGALMAAGFFDTDEGWGEFVETEKARARKGRGRG